MKELTIAITINTDEFGALMSALKHMHIITNDNDLMTVFEKIMVAHNNAIKQGNLQ